MILEWLIKDMKPKEDSSTVSLVSRLTSERDKKQKGSTPLHLAASLPGWPGVGFLPMRFPQATARLLLDANESTAYQADDQGWYPIHVAAWSGSLTVVKLLLDDMESRRRRQDCATLRDGKGRTFLHVAAEMKSQYCGAAAVVQYVCGEMPQQLSSMILNVQDSNGDTALHGAVRAGNLAGSTCLLRNRLVRLDVANKDGMTPLDLSWTTLPSGFGYAFVSILFTNKLEVLPPYISLPASPFSSFSVHATNLGKLYHRTAESKKCCTPVIALFRSSSWWRPAGPLL